MERHRGRTERKGQMGGGRAEDRQESDGEKAIGELAKGGGLSAVSTLNEGKREERRWVSDSSHAQKCLPLNSEEKSNFLKCNARDGHRDAFLRLFISFWSITTPIHPHPPPLASCLIG